MHKQAIETLQTLLIRYVNLTGSADIPNVSAAELTDFIKNGYLEKKRPGIGW